MSDETMKVFNAGTRAFTCEGGTLAPKAVKELPLAEAEKLMRMYPNELVEAGRGNASHDEVAQLKAELRQARKRIAELEAAAKQDNKDDNKKGAASNKKASK